MELKESAEALQDVIREYERRAQLVKDAGVDTIYQVREDMPEPIFVIVDEAAECLAPLPKSFNKGARDNQELVAVRLLKIARLCRFVGIHLILCTQPPMPR